jgi:hypothetical protein
VRVGDVVENGFLTMHNPRMIAKVATVLRREVKERTKEEMSQIDGDAVSLCWRTHTPNPAVEWHYEYCHSTSTVIHATTSCGPEPIRT